MRVTPIKRSVSARLITLRARPAICVGLPTQSRLAPSHTLASRWQEEDTTVSLRGRRAVKSLSDILIISESVKVGSKTSLYPPGARLWTKC